jgi:hypothetical protein
MATETDRKMEERLVLALASSRRILSAKYFPEIVWGALQDEIIPSIEKALALLRQKEKDAKPRLVTSR